MKAEINKAAGDGPAIFDGAGNLFVVDGGDASGKGNAVYKFTLKGKRSTFASGQASSETFSHIALQPMPVCCQ